MSDTPSASSSDKVASTARKGLAVTFLGQGLKLGAQFGATLVLARWLGPSDFGLVGMALPFTGLLVALNTTAFSAYTIQRATLDEDEASTVFWFNVLVGVLLTGLGIVCAPGIAWFYGVEAVSIYVVVLSTRALMHALLATHRATLARRMSWRRLMVAETGSTVLAAALAIGAAVQGAGPWSLVVLQVGQVGLHAAAAWILSGWVPRVVWDREAAGRVFRFGGDLTVFNLVNYIGRNADDVLIGWWLGERALGLYMLAYRLLLVPLRAVMVPITQVAVTSLSRLQEDGESWAKHYLDLMTLTVVISVPFVMILRHLTADVVVMLLGESWLAAVAVFEPLSIVALLHASFTTFGWVWISTGRPDRMRSWALFANPLTVAALAAGLPWGIEGVATAYLIIQLAQFPVGIHWALATTPLTPRRFLASLGRPLVLMGLLEVGLLGVVHVLPTPGLLRLVVAVPLVLGAFVGLVLALWGIGPLREAFAALRTVASRRSRS